MHRHSMRLYPDNKRVILRSFIPNGMPRLTGIIGRAAATGSGQQSWFAWPKGARAEFYRRISPRLSASTNTSMTLAAAPLRIESVNVQNVIAPGFELSERMRPTSTLSVPATSIGVG